MPATVRRISTTPVKGLALHHPDAVELDGDGARGDRAFFLVDARGQMVGAKGLAALASTRAIHDEAAGTLTLAFSDGERVDGEVVPGELEPVRFFGRPTHARPVAGPFSEALSERTGRPLRLMARGERGGVDRGRQGGVSLLGDGSLRRLATEAGNGDTVDDRRFRMLFVLAGLDAHEEDGWVGRRVRIGDAVVTARGHVGRCAVTTRDPDSGTADLPTLKLLQGYRGALETTEPLAFGVYGEVLEPGRVAVGDAAEPLDS